MSLRNLSGLPEALKAEPYTEAGSMKPMLRFKGKLDPSPRVFAKPVSSSLCHLAYLFWSSLAIIFIVAMVIGTNVRHEKQ